MTTNEKLERIAAKCREFIEYAEGNVTDFYGGLAIAGWRSTIAAIERTSRQIVAGRLTGDAELLLADILAAWEGLV